MTGRAVVLTAGALLSAAAIVSDGRAQDEAAPESPPGAAVEAVRQTAMGPVCWAAIVESIRQIGIRCFDRKDTASIAELERSSQALGKMFLERGWTAEQLERFRRQMGEADTPSEKLCANNDAIQFYQAFAGADQSELAKTTDEMLARPGPPEWGTCL